MHFDGHLSRVREERTRLRAEENGTNVHRECLQVQRRTWKGNPSMERSEAELERETLGRVTRRLIPFIFLLYVFNILDRMNVSIAVLTMKADLGFTDGVYGFGAGIFFIGYFFFQVPSNAILHRVGARRWLSRIVMAWGITASCMLFVHSAWSFYAIRFLLGVAQAGFFPGMMLYLTYWFPNAIRGRTAARFVLAGVFANIIGGPLGAQFLKLDGVGGLQGWQWLFLLEGIPAVLLGGVALRYLTDRPEQAHWLKPDQREWLIRRMTTEQEHQARFHQVTFLQALAYPRVRHLSAIFFLNVMAGSGVGLFSNLILRQRSGWPDQTVLWVSALPPIIGAVTVLLAATYSDRTNERRLFVITGLSIACMGMVVCATAGTGLLTVLGLCTIAIGGQIANAPFWALSTGFLTGNAAAGGIALINSIGNSGSFFGPALTGFLRDRLGAYEPALLVLACILACAAFVAYLLPPDPAQKFHPQVESATSAATP